ncbi:MAG TPA: 3-keto-5-aminohexanoate cleavage protein [Dehalococcoidia bacterium]|nr:3-keto-5-aminohexanoate cleavage protein [Dehalococcoidia bacterium]
MSGAPVLVKACLNGARPAGSHPALPVTPEQLAAAARAAQAAGAGAVHIHPRDPSGRESLAAADVGAALRAVRAACPGLPVGVTTGAWIVSDAGLRRDLVSAWTEMPDFASVNWREEGAEDLAGLLLERGVGVEAGLFTLEDAFAFRSSPIAPACLRALVEVRRVEEQEPIALAAAMDAALVDLGIDVLHHGFGQDTWGVLEAALRLGRDIRIGLEDTFTLPDGATAPDNAALVRAACDLARSLGRLPSS